MAREFNKDAGIWTLTQEMLDGIKKDAENKGFIEGAKYALAYVVNELGIELEGTDIYDDYFTNEENN